MGLRDNKCRRFERIANLECLIVDVGSHSVSPCKVFTHFSKEELQTRQPTCCKMNPLIRYYLQTRILVEILDSNDHSPAFTQPLYQFYVSENDAVGVRRQLVGGVTAQDADMAENARVTYHITSPNTEGLFDIPQVRLGMGSLAFLVDQTSLFHDRFQSKCPVCFQDTCYDFEPFSYLWRR